MVQAYASLGGQDAGAKKLEPLGGRLLDHPTVTALATKHNVSAGHVLLAWALQQDVAIIPKSAKVRSASASVSVSVSVRAQDSPYAARP